MLASTPPEDLLLGINDVEEPVLLVLVLLVDASELRIVSHERFAISQKDHTLVLITLKLQFLPDNGQNLMNLEGVGHQESMVIIKASLLRVSHFGKRSLL